MGLFALVEDRPTPKAVYSKSGLKKALQDFDLISWQTGECMPAPLLPPSHHA